MLGGWGLCGGTHVHTHLVKGSVPGDCCLHWGLIACGLGLAKAVCFYFQGQYLLFLKETIVMQAKIRLKTERTPGALSRLVYSQRTAALLARMHTCLKSEIIALCTGAGARSPLQHNEALPIGFPLCLQGKATPCDGGGALGCHVAPWCVCMSLMAVVPPLNTGTPRSRGACVAPMSGQHRENRSAFPVTGTGSFPRLLQPLPTACWVPELPQGPRGRACLPVVALTWSHMCALTNAHSYCAMYSCLFSLPLLFAVPLVQAGLIRTDVTDYFIEPLERGQQDKEASGRTHVVYRREVIQQEWAEPGGDLHNEGKLRAGPQALLLPAPSRCL